MFYSNDFCLQCFFSATHLGQETEFCSLDKKAKTDKRKVFLKLCSKFNLKIIFYLSTSRFCLVGMGKKSCRRLQRILLKKNCKKVSTSLSCLARIDVGGCEDQKTQKSINSFQHTNLFLAPKTFRREKNFFRTDSELTGGASFGRAISRFRYSVAEKAGPKITNTISSRMNEACKSNYR